jgi:hypothetical protein
MKMHLKQVISPDWTHILSKIFPKDIIELIKTARKKQFKNRIIDLDQLHGSMRWYFHTSNPHYISRTIVIENEEENATAYDKSYKEIKIVTKMCYNRLTDDTVIQFFIDFFMSTWISDIGYSGCCSRDGNEVVEWMYEEQCMKGYDISVWNLYSDSGVYIF